MAITSIISSKEFERVSALAYEGKTLKVMICDPIDSASSLYDQDTTVSDWKTIELSGNGYVEHSEVIASGSYNPTSGRYEIPAINAEFTSTSSYSYSRIVIYIEGELYPHSYIVEDPNITLSSGQTQTYRINLNIDD